MSEIDDYIASVPELRQERIQHLLDVIEAAEPGLPRRLWSYGGGVVGVGLYHYRSASGSQGEFFMLGVGNRKQYVSIFSTYVDGDQYLAESFKERLPGCKIGKSCIELPDKVTVEDDVMADLTRQTVAQFRAEFQKPKLPKTMQYWE